MSKLELTVKSKRPSGYLGHMSTIAPAGTKVGDPGYIVEFEETTGSVWIPQDVYNEVSQTATKLEEDANRTWILL